MVLNIVAIIGAILFILYAAYLVAKRNPTVKCKLSEDIFVYAVILIILTSIFTLDNAEDTMLISAYRNIIIYLALFVSMIPKRGISDKGMVFGVFTIPWSKCENLRVNEHLTSRIAVNFHFMGIPMKLLATKPRLREVIAELQKHVDQVYIQDTLDPFVSKKAKR